MAVIVNMLGCGILQEQSSTFHFYRRNSNSEKRDRRRLNRKWSYGKFTL